MNDLAITSSKFPRYDLTIAKFDAPIPPRVSTTVDLQSLEEMMRRIVLAFAATAAILAAGAFAPGAAQAMTLSTPAAIEAAIDDSSLAQDVAYVCRRVWRCGPYGCGWRRNCWWTGPRRYYRRHWRRW